MNIYIVTNLQYIIILSLFIKSEKKYIQKNCKKTRFLCITIHYLSQDLVVFQIMQCIIVKLYCDVRNVRLR